MTNSFRFRSGKYKGETYMDVLERDPGYIDWVMMERPEMLRERSKQPAKTVVPSYLQEPEEEEEPVRAFKPLTPNYNFENEIHMTPEERNTGEQEIKNKLTKLKIGLYSKLSQETIPNGRVKYDKNWLVDTIFDSDEDSEIRDKIKSRINDNNS